MYIIIYDFGTSSVKTCLFNIDSKIELIKSATAAYNIYIGDNGSAEQDTEEWWQALSTTTKALFDDTEIKPEEIAHTSDKSVARFLAIELYERLKHRTFENFGQDKKLVDSWTFDIDKYLSLNRTKEQEDRIFYAIDSLENSRIRAKVFDARSLIKNLDFIGR